MKITNLKEAVFNLESANYPFVIEVKDNTNKSFSVIAESENWHSEPDDEYYDWCINVTKSNGMTETAYIDAYFGGITFE